jgi:light-regulated signal transduction histidine kinase (bacteriophytochrome)
VDEQGNLRDERSQRVEIEKTIMNKALFERKVSLIYSEVDILQNHTQGIVVTGEHAEAMLWDGHEASGYVSVDNLLRHQPLTQQKREILLLYAQVIGHLAAIKKKEASVNQLNLELEQRVRQRTAQLEASYQEMESFTYSISHDLRAPLRSLNGFSQVLQEDHADQLDDVAKDYLRRIRQASTHMAELTDALLRLARISRSDMQVETVRLDVLANEITAALAAGDPERKVEWRITPDLTCQADQVLAGIVLENLLGNSWKFTAKHPVARIEVGILQRADQNYFFVRDDGAGFDMEYRDKLFNPFQRLHSSAEFDGTGIGLAIVQRIIRRHNGNIWAEGYLEKGATFYFTFGDGTLQTANNG